jgi:hypothetical protein
MFDSGKPENHDTERTLRAGFVLEVGIVEERAAGTGDVLDLALEHPTC